MFHVLSREFIEPILPSQLSSLSTHVCYSCRTSITSRASVLHFCGKHSRTAMDHVDDPSAHATATSPSSIPTPTSLGGRTPVLPCAAQIRTSPGYKSGQ